MILIQFIVLQCPDKRSKHHVNSSLEWGDLGNWGEEKIKVKSTIYVFCSRFAFNSADLSIILVTCFQHCWNALTPASSLHSLSFPWWVIVYRFYRFRECSLYTTVHCVLVWNFLSTLNWQYNRRLHKEKS